MLNARDLLHFKILPDDFWELSQRDKIWVETLKNIYYSCREVRNILSTYGTRTH